MLAYLFDQKLHLTIRVPASASSWFLQNSFRENYTPKMYE